MEFQRPSIHDQYRNYQWLESIAKDHSGNFEQFWIFLHLNVRTQELYIVTDDDVLIQILHVIKVVDILFTSNLRTF